MAPHSRILLALSALAAAGPGCGGARLDMKKVLSLVPRGGPQAQAEAGKAGKAHPVVEKASSAVQALVSWLQSQGAQVPAEAPVQPSDTFIRDVTSSLAAHQTLKKRVANSTAKDVVRWLSGGREPEEEPVLPGEALVRDATSSLHLHRALKERVKRSEWGKKLHNATLKDAVRWLNGGREPQEEPVLPGEALTRDSLSSLDLHRALTEKLTEGKVAEKLHDTTVQMAKAEYQALDKLRNTTVKDAVRWLNGGREPQEEPVLPGEALTRDSLSSLDLHRALKEKLKETKVAEKLHDTAAKVHNATLKDAVRWLNGGREPEEEPVLPGEALTRDSLSSLDLHHALKEKLKESKVAEKLHDTAAKVHNATLKDAVRWLNGGREPLEEPVLPGEALTRDSLSSLDLHRAVKEKLKKSKVAEKLDGTSTNAEKEKPDTLVQQQSGAAPHEQEQQG